MRIIINYFYYVPVPWYIMTISFYQLQNCRLYIITIYYHSTNYLFKVKRSLLIISDMFCTWIYFSIETVHHYTILRNL